MPGAICDNTLDDIEDLVHTGDVTPNERYASRKQVVPKAKVRKRGAENGASGEGVSADSIIPGTLLLTSYLYERLACRYISH